MDNSKLTKAIDKVRACNDKLGRYSDHEGNENGSTVYFWNGGYAAFDSQCQRAINDHNAAIKAWRVLRRINEQRKVVAPKAHDKGQK